MNKNQVKGGIKEAAGAIQRKAGEVIGNPELQREGSAREVEGKVQKKVGDAQEAIEKSVDRVQSKLQSPTE